MRNLAALAALSLMSTAAVAQTLGARTATPDQTLGSVGQGSPVDEVEAMARAAAGQPLGSAANPVRVGGPDGERSYLARLRCGNGAAPRVGARRDAGTGPYGSVVAAYEVDCGAAAPGAARIVFDMYHAEHAETQAPTGFALTR